VRQQVHPDPLSGIAHHHLHLRAHAAHHDLHAPALGREFHRVGDEIPHHLLQAVGIAVDESARRLDQRGEPQLLGLRRRAHRLHDVADDIAHIERPDAQPHPPAHHVGEVQQILHETRLRGDVPEDDLDRAMRLLLGEAAVLQQPGPAQHRVQRIAQLVRERGEKLVTGAIGHLDAAACGVGGAAETLAFDGEGGLLGGELGHAQVGPVVAAAGLGNGQGEGAEHAVGPQERRDDPGAGPQPLERPRHLRVRRFGAHVGGGGARGHDGASRLRGGVHRPGEVESARERLTPGVGVRDGHADTDPIVRDQIDGAEIAQLRHGQSRHARQRVVYGQSRGD
jgi:hypothetical protein